MRDTYIYRVDIKYYEEADREWNSKTCFLYATSFTDAMDDIINYFGEDCIDTVSFSCYDISMLMVSPELGDKIIEELE